MTSVHQEAAKETERPVVKVRPSDVALARLWIVTSRNLGEPVPAWVEKVANAKPRQR